MCVFVPVREVREGLRRGNNHLESVAKDDFTHVQPMCNVFVCVICVFLERVDTSSVCRIRCVWMQVCARACVPKPLRLCKGAEGSP